MCYIWLCVQLRVIIFNGKQFPPSQYNAKHEWVQLVHSKMRLIKNTPLLVEKFVSIKYSTC